MSRRQRSVLSTRSFRRRLAIECAFAFAVAWCTVRSDRAAAGCPVAFMSGAEAPALARHKQSTGLFVSGLSPPGPNDTAHSARYPPPLLHSTGHPTTALQEAPSVLCDSRGPRWWQARGGGVLGDRKSRRSGRSSPWTERSV